MEHTKINYLLCASLREWRRWNESRTLQFITVIGPLVSFFLVAWLFSSNVPRELPVAIVDLDHTALSRQMVRMVDATAIASVNRNYTSLDEARLAMEEGRVDAIVCIPKNTEKDVFRGYGANIALYLNNTNVLKGGLLNSGIRKALSTFSTGMKLQIQLKNGLTQEQALSRVMPVQLRQVLLFNPYTSYSYYLTAALMPVLLIVFVLIGSVYVMGDELYKGTGPQWIRCGGGNFMIALLGKMLPYTVCYGLLAMVMNLVLFQFLGMPLHGHLGIILFSEFLLILSYQSFSIVLLAVTSNLRLSLSLGSAYCMLALTYSGLTFPVFGMPLAAHIFSKILPFTYWLKILISQSLRGEPVTNNFTPLFSLLLFIIFGVLFIPRLRTMLLNRKRWGKI